MIAYSENTDLVPGDWNNGQLNFTYPLTYILKSSRMISAPNQEIADDYHYQIYALIL